jgi:hypothetical protein
LLDDSVAHTELIELEEADWRALSSSALISSTYLRREDGWKLMLH